MARKSAEIVLLVAALLAPLPDATQAQAQHGSGILRVGTSGDYAPFSLRLGTDPGSEGAATNAASYSGFDIEVAYRFAAASGYRVEFVPFRWPDLTRDLAAGRFDVAMSGVTMRADRSLTGRFTVPVATTQAVALSWRGANASGVHELDTRTRRIAVNAGGYLEGVARRVFPFAHIIALPDNDAVRMALLDRWTDAVVTDDIEERHWTAGTVGVVRIGPLSDDRKAYLVRADREDLASQLDIWLLARERDGSLDRLRATLLGRTAEAPVAAPLPALVCAIAERLSVMPAVWAAKHEAGLPIDDKTQEASVLAAAEGAVRDAAVAASRPPPDRQRVRAFFGTLIAAAKDQQRRSAEQQRALVRQRREEHRERSRAAAGGAQEAQAAARAAQIASEKSTQVPTATDTASEEATFWHGPADRDRSPEIDTRPQVRPLYDLETQIRPAIARITGKISRLLVALDTPLTGEAVERLLSVALAPYQVRADHISAISGSIAALSTDAHARGRD